LPFVPLHNHSDYSLLDGVLNNTAVGARRKPREIAKLVIESLLTGIEAR